MRAPLVLMAAALVLTACGAAPRAAAPAPVTAPTAAPVLPSHRSVVPPAPAPSPAAAVPAVALSWRVGGSPLPLRADGFGQVLATPPALRDRRLTAASALPPPAGGRFAATDGPVTSAVRERMGTTWSPACPVALADLRYLTVSFRGFDGLAHTGEVVVAASVAGDVTGLFRRLFAAGFPIEQMRLPTTADLEAEPTGDGNNTAGYVCRAARGQTRWSQHAFGLAVDVNPFQNPSVKRDLVLPELASAYVDRDDRRPGMHHRDGPAVRGFAAVGWEWGGDWRSSKDWMHFSQDGR